MYKLLKNWLLCLVRSFRVLSLAGLVIFAAACGSSPNATAKSPTIPPGLPQSIIDAAKPNTDICTMLTSDDIGQALSIAPDTVQGNSIGKVCTYSDSNMIVNLTYVETGGSKAISSTHDNLGSKVLDVPGLGDLAFYNTNSSNALFVLKGDSEFIFQVSNLNDETLDTDFVRSAEKTLAEKIISKLP